MDNTKLSKNIYKVILIYNNLQSPIDILDWKNIDIFDKNSLYQLFIWEIYNKYKLKFDSQKINNLV